MGNGVGVQVDRERWSEEEFKEEARKSIEEESIRPKEQMPNEKGIEDIWNAALTGQNDTDDTPQNKTITFSTLQNVENLAESITRALHPENKGESRSAAGRDMCLEKLQAELDAERAKSAALENELASAKEQIAEGARALETRPERAPKTVNDFDPERWAKTVGEITPADVTNDQLQKALGYMNGDFHTSMVFSKINTALGTM